MKSPDEILAQFNSAFGDHDSSQELVQRLEQNPDALQAIRSRARLGLIDIATLSHLPVGTLGELFSSHMIKNSLSPITDLPVVDVESYVVAHLVETHELWRVVTGFGSDLAGECGLNGFY